MTDEMQAQLIIDADSAAAQAQLPLGADMLSNVRAKLLSALKAVDMLEEALPTGNVVQLL